MVDLIANMPTTRALQFVKEHWNWIPVTLVQEYLDVSSLGFINFIEEMASKNLLELSEDKTQVRCIRPDYSLLARIRYTIERGWYLGLFILAFAAVFISGLGNTLIGALIVLSALMVGPLWALFRIAKNAWIKENENEK